MCFNEAAAKGRGKRGGIGDVTSKIFESFNEAAAKGRGKRGRGVFIRGSILCFNEAAAKGRGKQDMMEELGRRGKASMRPRRKAAENKVKG